MVHTIDWNNPHKGFSGMGAERLVRLDLTCKVCGQGISTSPYKSRIEIQQFFDTALPNCEGGSKMIQSDITGGLHKSVDGWESKADRLCHPENFFVSIEYGTQIARNMSVEDRKRLDTKLLVVERFAKLMACGVLKGTLKYSGDDWGVEEWFAHLLGEGADFANYIMLLVDRFEKEKENEGRK